MDHPEAGGHGPRVVPRVSQRRLDAGRKGGNPPTAVAGTDLVGEAESHPVPTDIVVGAAGGGSSCGGGGGHHHGHGCGGGGGRRHHRTDGRHGGRESERGGVGKQARRWGVEMGKTVASTR